MMDSWGSCFVHVPKHVIIIAAIFVCGLFFMSCQ